MTPKEKAQELVNTYKEVAYSDLYTQAQVDQNAKNCALVAVDEIINLLGPTKFLSPELTLSYWLKVKQEIETL